ncbi:hypothetical protein AB6A40_007053 [Gnathostoma spinigerum]|uniref:Uncharacterized protein n=1 Tax=Gnathostoma spinigerum TaxID=75299 RepID=A0ABD6ESR8_9BILA
MLGITSQPQIYRISDSTVVRYHLQSLIICSDYYLSDYPLFAGPCSHCSFPWCPIRTHMDYRYRYFDHPHELFHSSYRFASK